MSFVRRLPFAGWVLVLSLISPLITSVISQGASAPSLSLEFDFSSEPELKAELQTEVGRCKAEIDPASCFRKKIFHAREEFQMKMKDFPRTLHPALRTALADYASSHCTQRESTSLWTGALYCYWEALAGTIQRSHDFYEERENKSAVYEIIGGFCERKLGKSASTLVLKACWAANYPLLENQMALAVHVLSDAYTELRKYSIYLKASGLKINLPSLVAQSLDTIEYKPTQKFSWIVRRDHKIVEKNEVAKTSNESSSEEAAPTIVPTEPQKKSVVITGEEGWKKQWWTNGSGRGLLGNGAGHGDAGSGTGSEGASEEGGDEVGGKGILSSRSVRFFDFFQRVKARVETEWSPNEVWKMNNTDHASTLRDYLTILNVVLDSEGTLKSLSIKKTSGLGFLDDEALRSFRAASPIPNPPQGIIDEKGEVRFQFGFIFELSSGRSRFRGWR